MKLVFHSYLLLAVSAMCPYGYDVAKRDEVLDGASAAQKLNAIWAEIAKQKGTGGSFYFSAGIRLLRSDMSPTVEYVSDTMPSGRLKFLNTIGVVSKAVFEPAPNSPYTGMFQGASNMIIRPSFAAEIPKKETKLIPGAAVKFFRDGLPSANFVAMYSLEDQYSFNFFENPLSTHVPTNSLTGLLRTGYEKFSSVTDWPGFVGVSDVAAFTENGTKVAKPVFPFQIILKSNLTTPSTNDGKSDIFDSLTSIKKGTKIWEMYGSDCPKCAFTLMGTIKTNSDMIKSKYADETLFFKHQRFDEDVKLRPDWLKQCRSDKDCDSCLGYNTCQYE